MNFQKEASWVKQRVVKGANGLESDRLQQPPQQQNGDKPRPPAPPGTPPSPPTTPPSDGQQQLPADKLLLRKNSSIGRDDIMRSSRKGSGSGRDFSRQVSSAPSAAAAKAPEDDSKQAVAAGPQHPVAALEPLTFVQVQLLGFILVFAVSGLVPVDDLMFVLYAGGYSLALNWLVFPPLSEPPEKPPFSGTGWLRAYITGAAILGLFLPLAYVLGGFARGDQNAVQHATPHLFLLSCQVLAESLAGRHKWISGPTRAAIPVMYNARRLFSLSTWLRQMSPTGPMRSLRQAQTYWPLFGQLLAFSNYAFWSFNLFCFLLPVYLPYAFARYLESNQAGRNTAWNFPNFWLKALQEHH